MKLFSTYSARMTIVRKDGYYMSRTTARRVAVKLAKVLELSEYQVEQVVTQLTLGVTDDLNDHRCDGFTPAELEVIRNLACWYSYEYHSYEHCKEGGLVDLGPNNSPCFIALNLNRGFSLVITDGPKRSPMLSLSVKELFGEEARSGL